MNRIVLGLGFLFTVAACSSSSSSGTGTQTAADAGNGADAAKGGTADLGDPCPNGDSDCKTGLQCDGDDPGGGQCYSTCTPEKDTECPAGYACNSEGHCYLECKQTSDCPRSAQGYVCKDDTPARGVKFCDAAD